MDPFESKRFTSAKPITSAKGHEIGLHHDRDSGWFLRPDGSEGGGLWFTRNHLAASGLELIDYDGMFELPAAVATALREHGVLVGPDFNKRDWRAS